MRELSYRASRLCRLLGNPVVFAIVDTLAAEGVLTPGELAARVQRSGPLVSQHLSRLRLAELVRYETRGRATRYWLKHPATTRRTLAAVKGFVRMAAPLSGARRSR
jgi:DNA-binding transcriptional ArsR family regulator